MQSVIINLQSIPATETGFDGLFNSTTGYKQELPKFYFNKLSLIPWGTWLWVPSPSNKAITESTGLMCGHGAACHNLDNNIIMI